MKNWNLLALLAASVLGLATTAQAQSALRLFKMGPQEPVSANGGGLAYYQVTVTRAGGWSLDVYLTPSGLPTGCTVEFVPPKVSFTDNGPSTKGAIMVVRVPQDLPAGTYDFSVSARHGNSKNVLSCQNTLVVSSQSIAIQQPVLDIPVLQPDGTMGLSGSGTATQPVMVQATLSLALPSWETIAVTSLDERGLFSLVDQDATNYPARFYRLAQ